MIYAAGTLLITDDRYALFLKRGPGGDWPGAWCFPGGTCEEGESASDAADRETVEEIGFLPKGKKLLWTRRISANEAPNPDEAQNPVPPLGELVDYTTFIKRVDKQVAPELNGEHTAWVWAPIDNPPEPLHPGAKISLDRFKMNETDVAKSIRDGELTSPQVYENITFFALRITGTETAFRKKLNEYVYRKPDNYLNQEFLDRCNGLPVIWEHPKRGKLNTDEFLDRIVGTIVLPYIKGDEVWGIARIYDSNAALAMESNQLSTSPAVVFRSTDGNVKTEMDDGSTLLIEGNPSLLDHLAICEVGVWDKGGDPAGVELPTTETTSSKGSEMPEIEKEEAGAEKRDDAENMGGGNIDRLLRGIDALCDRMDAMEKRMDSAKMDEDTEMDDAAEDGEMSEDEKAEAKELASDSGKKERKDSKARKDADEPKEPSLAAEVKGDEDKEEEEKEDRADSAISDEIRAKVDRLSRAVSRMPKSMGDDDYATMADHQARADGVYAGFGKRAPAPLQGESPEAYEIRLLKGVQEHSTHWASVPLRALPAEARAIAREQIYADAASAARSPVNLPAGSLREIRRRDQSGREITEFFGEPSVWMGEFRTTPRSIAKPYFRPRAGG